MNQVWPEAEHRKMGTMTERPAVAGEMKIMFGCFLKSYKTA